MPKKAAQKGGLAAFFPPFFRAAQLPFLHIIDTYTSTSVDVRDVLVDVFALCLEVSVMSSRLSPLSRQQNKAFCVICALRPPPCPDSALGYSGPEMPLIRQRDRWRRLSHVHGPLFLCGAQNLFALKLTDLLLAGFGKWAPPNFGLPQTGNIQNKCIRR